jgi:hypothetical protein
LGRSAHPDGGGRRSGAVLIICDGVAVNADGKSLSCTINQLPSTEAADLELTCRPPIPAKAKFTVLLSAGLVATSSALPVALGGSDPDSRTIDVPEPATGAGCRTWRELELH